MKKHLPKPSRKADDRIQSDAFIQKAREIQADETTSAADQLLAHLHAQPPQQHRPSKQKRRATPERERRDLSLEVSIIRARYARALGREPWTADAALDTAEED